MCVFLFVFVCGWMSARARALMYMCIYMCKCASMCVCLCTGVVRCMAFDNKWIIFLSEVVATAAARSGGCKDFAARCYLKQPLSH